MARPSKTDVGWALLFAVPPGVGVTGFVTYVVGETAVVPVAILAGLLTATIIFLLVVAGVSYGSPADAEAG